MRDFVVLFARILEVRKAGDPVREHLIRNAQHMRLFFMGFVLLLVLRYSPGGVLLPERVRKKV